MKSCFVPILFFSVLFLVGCPANGKKGGGGDDDDAAPASPSTPVSCPQLNLASVDFVSNTSSFSCSSAWSSQGFTLMFQRTGPDVWTFIVSAPDNKAYISIAFAPSGGMIGSSAVAGWVPAGGGGVVRQYSLGGYSSGSCPPDKGSLKLGRTAILSQSSTLYLAFQLNTTTQPETQLIFAVGPTGSLPGPDFLLPKHQSKASTTIDYTTGGTGATTSGGDGGPAGANDNTKVSSSSCSGALNVNSKLINFDTSSMSCSNAWAAQSFTIFYKQSGPSQWSFILSAPDNGAYISVGFSSNGNMVGSSAIAGWVSGGTSAVAKQYYLGGTSSSSCPPDSGDLQLAKPPVIISQSNRLYLAFQLNATRPQSNLIYAVGPTGNFPGSDNLLPTHRSKVSTYIDYTTGATSGSSGAGLLKSAHGILGMLGWGVLMPVGVIMARYMKHLDPLWFYSHISIQGLGFLIGVVCVLTGFALEDKVGVEVDAHKGIGIFILVLGCLQVMAFLIRPNKTAKIRRYWNWYHHNVGRIAIAFAVVNIFYGLSLAHEATSWSVGYGVFLGIWILSCVGLEARMRMRDD